MERAGLVFCFIYVCVHWVWEVQRCVRVAQSFQGDGRQMRQRSKAPLKCLRKGSSLKKTGLAWFRSDMIRYSYHGLNLKWLKEHIILNLDFTDTLMKIPPKCRLEPRGYSIHLRCRALTYLQPAHAADEPERFIESIEHMAVFVTYWGQLNVLIYFDSTKNNLKKHKLEPIWHAFEIKTSD